MKSEINTLRYVPSHYNGHFDGYFHEDHENVVSNCEVFFTTAPLNNRWYAIGYSGKGAKPVFHNAYRSKEEMNIYKEAFIKNCKDVIKYKADRKAEQKKANENIKVDVGMIFVNSWGYDQTNVDYYQVVAVKGHNVHVRKIGSEAVKGSDGFMSCNVRPVKDSFIGTEVHVKRVSGYNGKPYLSFSYGSGSLVEEGQTNYCSWYA